MSETLVIVTSDHASAITYSGFATSPNNSVLGMDKFLSDVDKKSYQLLMYASGPGNENYNETLARIDPQNAYHKATIPQIWGNHDATDVPLYAKGPMANVLFSGSMDQTYIAHAIAFALCLFQYESRCESFRTKPTRHHSKIHELRHELYKSRQYDNLMQDYITSTTPTSTSSTTAAPEETSDLSNEIGDDYFETSTEIENDTYEIFSVSAIYSSNSSNSTTVSVLSGDTELTTDHNLSAHFDATVFLSDVEKSSAITHFMKFEQMYYLLLFLYVNLFLFTR